MDTTQIALDTPENIALNLHLAGLGSRGLALIVDMLIQLMLSLALIIVIALSAGHLSAYPLLQSLSGYFLAWVVVLTFLLLWAYYLIFEFFLSGQTPGKRLAGIQVIQDNGQNLTFLSAVLRNLFRIIDMIFWIGAWLIFLHPRHKRIGDLVAGTLVVYQSHTQRLNKSAQKKIQARIARSTVNVSWDEQMIRRYNAQDWELLKTFVWRSETLPYQERTRLTNQVAEVLLSRTGINLAGYTPTELEALLLHLYQQLLPAWSY
ncbi:MAG: RDD family protein [Peptococcaceae bacterium]|jgi:uncharacterized RDD family membrane protein YckC|nr:RDD family protein [Peptococcaceae bacterium]